jgi:predicted enzyme related to lactoylglutathione lyase
MDLTESDLRIKYRAGIPCWVDTTQHDVDEAVAFYGGLFGWEYEERPVPVDGARYLIARKDGQVVGGLGTPSPAGPGGARWNTYVALDDVDATAARFEALGGTISSPPEDAGPAGRSALCLDPTGAQIGLWQQGRRIGAERVNQDGAWNWSDLLTDEPDEAAAFYAEVFGWEARPVSFDGGDSTHATMWAKPGYGDALAEIDPTIRERHSGPQVPAGFSDALGWLMPAEEGTSWWRVTFAVDDTDHLAEMAAKLGGEVIEEPHDAGPVRDATLADPAGARFVISRYQP